MRFPLSPRSVLLGVLLTGCSPTAPTGLETVPEAEPHFSVESADASCTLAVHAILREAGPVAAVGQVQFRIDPPEPGSTDAKVEYRGVYVPTGGPTFDVLSTELVARVPEQLPSWSDAEQGDPGTTLLSVVEFGRTTPMSQAMALALIDDASRFKTVVNVVGATGGREAEGIVAPRTGVPESVRDRQRVCFGAG